MDLQPSHQKILGLGWNSELDTFQFTSWPISDKKITKRSVLSEISQLFDPLGFLSPIIIRAKIFMQELWLLRNGWDENLSTDKQIRWTKFRQELCAISKFTIPRWLHTSSSVQSIEIHGFSDASQSAMAAVIYTRIVNKNQEIIINFINAKTKVAPLKQLTIPHLELNAALLLTRLTSHVQKVLNLKTDSVYLWTDSSITLTWISTHPSRWKDYVRNRVTLIQEISPQAIWRYIPSKDNPADCASRGLTIEKLHKHPLWWTGPSWLLKPSSF